MAKLPLELDGVEFGNVDSYLPSENRDDGPRIPEGMAQVIDIREAPMRAMVDGGSVTETADGGVIVDLEGAEATPDSEGPIEFEDNLAKYIPEGQLSDIASTVIDWIDADLASRTEWFDRLADGLELLGLTPQKTLQGVWKLADKLHHPLLNEAAVQFQARAISELVPPGGPAKGLVLGERTEEKDGQAERVEDYQNYQLMVEDTAFYHEEDSLMFVLSLNGSQFKKVYREPLLARNVTRWVRGEYFVVPYGETELESAKRYTHIIPTTQNDMKKLQRSGFYRDVALTRPNDAAPGHERAKEQKDTAQGQTNAAQLLLDEEDYCPCECHCYYDLPGFEDEEDGEPTGIGLPYIITVDYHSRAVLSIRRNWDENDPRRERLQHFVHKPFLPGDGFYSYGLLHHLGGLSQTATGLVKTIVLSCAFAGMQGGAKSKDAKLPSDWQLEFGVYKDVDMTAEELDKCFWTPNFKGPPEASFKILELLLGAGQRFASTTESMVGDASNTGPVGTTVALIEQGSKVYSGIHKRLHIAMGKELQLLAKLNGKHIPEGGYPYDVHGESRMIYRQDFDGRVDVVPVSDPNIFSSTQRIAIGQSLVQRADQAPDLYDRRKVEKRLLEALRVPDPDDVLISKGKIQRCDPVTENALMLVGKAARVFLDQDHDAHQAVHQRQIDEFASRPAGDPMAQRLLPVMFAHQAEHMATGMRVKIFQVIGIPLPPMDLYAEGDDPVSQELTPAVENEIARRAAIAISQMPRPAGDAQAEQLQQQAQALQQQADELAKERQQLDGMREAAEKASMKAAYDNKVSNLTSQLATLRTEIAQMKAGASTQALLDAAVNRVEGAIQQLVAEKAAK